MRSVIAAALTLTVLMPHQAMAASITVMPGDTISDIADRYGVSVRRLMQVNGIDNPDHVEVGQTLRLPSGAKGFVSAGQGRHTVQQGDTLGDIAARYQVSERDLMVINNLPKADHVEVGQRLKLPTTAVLPQPKPVAQFQPTPIKANPNATFHTVARGQTLTQIAQAYQVPVASLIDLNTINDPDTVAVGTKLMLRKSSRTENAPSVSSETAKPVVTAKASKPVQSISTKTNASKVADAQTSSSKTAPTNSAATKSVEAKPAAWRTYGPLQVDWSNWQSMGGSMVAPTLNSEGKPLYIAVNCSAQKINVTSSDGAWKSWIAPQTHFEKDLVSDRCKPA